MKSVLNKKLVGLSAAFSMGVILSATTATASDYYSGPMEVRNVVQEEFGDMTPQLPEYVGYANKDRVSTGSRENAVDVELDRMRAEATNAYVNETDRLNGGTKAELEGKLEVQLYNYEQYVELEKQADVWDKNRMAEIQTAQQVRSEYNMDCNSDDSYTKYDQIMCQYPGLTTAEAEEMLQIQERMDERNKWKAHRSNLQSEAKLADTQAHMDTYKNEDGIIEDVDKYAKDGANKALMASLAATSAFCMLDVPSALADPSGMCKKAVCAIMGKWTCKAIGF